MTQLAIQSIFTASWDDVAVILTPANRPSFALPQRAVPKLAFETEETRPWEVFRAEGLPLGESLRSGLSYLRKYISKKWSVSDDKRAHFDSQKAWFDYFKARDGAENKPETTAAMVGDIMWVRDSWETFLSPEVQRTLNASDVVLGNLETPISKSNSVPSLLPDVVKFNAPPTLLTSFEREDGSNTFTALSLANNHTYDMGVEGARETKEVLAELGIGASGVRGQGESPFAVFEKGGVKFGFYAATWGLNDPALENAPGLELQTIKGLTPVRVGEQPSDEARLEEIRSVLKQMADEGVEQKVISLHWGHEFEMYPTTAQMNVARQIVAAGADIILGSHSHVVQPNEMLFVNGYEESLGADAPPVTDEMKIDGVEGPPRKALVIYSPGNFTTNMYTTQCQLGAVNKMEFHRDPQSRRVDWDDVSTELVFNQRGGFFGERKLLPATDENLSQGQRQERDRLRVQLNS